jgi:hypothetical protein
MTEVDITGVDLKKTTSQRRLVENKGNWIIDHVVLALPLSVTFVLGTVAVDYWEKPHTQDQSVIFSGLFALSVLFTIYTAVKIQLNKEFIAMKTHHPKKESRQRVGELIHEEGWTTLRNNQDYAMVAIPGRYLPAQELIILFREEEVLVNIRLASGIRGRLPFSFGRNKRVIKKIEQRIKTPSNIKQADQHAPKPISDALGDAGGCSCSDCHGSTPYFKEGDRGDSQPGSRIFLKTKEKQVQGQPPKGCRKPAKILSLTITLR